MHGLKYTAANHAILCSFEADCLSESSSADWYLGLKFCPPFPNPDSPAGRCKTGFSISSSPTILRVLGDYLPPSST